MSRRARRLLVVAAVALVVVVLAARGLVGLYTELLWYEGRGYGSTFWRRFGIGLSVRTVAAVVGAAIVLLNGWLVARLLGPVRVRRRYGNIEIAEQIPRRYITWAVVAIAVLAGWWLSGLLFADGAALRVAAWLVQQPWGVQDPLLGRDIGFYIFTLPVYYQVVDYLLLVVLWSLALVALGHVLVGGIRWDENRLVVGDGARLHLTILAAVMIVFIGIRYWLGRYSLVLDGNGVGGGVGYTDVHARLPAHWILTGLSLLAAGTLVYGVAQRRRILPFVGLGALLAGALLVGQAYPSVVQKFRVEPTELAREAPYIRWNMDFTLRAFGLGELESTRFPFDRAAAPDWDRASRDLDRLALWDPEPLRTAYNQVQALFNYYRFHDVDYDRYGPVGEERQTAIAVREFEVNGLPSEARTWQSVRLNPRYVRGVGAVVSPAAVASSEPVRWIQDIDPVVRDPAAPGELVLDEPSVFFGEQMGEYAILIPGREGAFTGEPGTDYPAGVALSSFTRVLAFAWRFGDKNLLFSGEVTRDSRFVFRRPLQGRVSELVPFLLWDPDPYAVIHQGRLVWMMDGYTASTSFPMARAVSLPGMRTVRYLRNSVKATVDAVTGAVTFYAVRDDEPVLETFRNLFPGLVRPIQEMPRQLRRHLRVPALSFLAQVEILHRYHLTEVEDFYAQRDVWARPQEAAPGGGSRPYRPTYAMIRLPGSEALEFLTMMPFIADNRQNMTALLVARNDPERYGELDLYELPRDQLIPGPTQIQTIMEQDPVISTQLSLWRQAGSDVDMGHLRVVPLESSFLYVVPLFLSAEDSAIPQLRRVVLSDGTTVSWGETLAEALARLGAGRTAPVEEPGPEVPGTAGWPARALDILDAAAARLRAGDWAGYGARMDELRALLERFRGGG